MKLIKIQGKLYNLLGMYGGKVYVSKLFDVNNNVVKKGIIWEMQPFYWDKDINYLLKSFIYIIRYFKVDVFGNSQFKIDIGLKTIYNGST